MWEETGIPEEWKETIIVPIHKRGDRDRCENYRGKALGNAAYKILSNIILRKIKPYSWTDHVRNEEVLLRVNEQRNILQEIRKQKANWIGHILHRNCLLKQVIEGKIKGEMEVARR